MRVVFIGVSHWHLQLYLKPALETPGVEIVGVSDPNSAVAKAAAERARCKFVGGLSRDVPRAAAPILLSRWDAIATWLSWRAF